MVNIMVIGAAGKMGSEVVRAVTADPETQLVSAVDPGEAGKDAGDVAGIGSIGVEILEDIALELSAKHIDVAIDFTHPSSVFENAKKVIDAGRDLLIGTTGLSDGQIDELSEKATTKDSGVLVAPNFAIGAVLMMKFAREAASFMDGCEIIELHHDQKADSPSGTALRTARLISETTTVVPGPGQEMSRGWNEQGVMIHSVRLKGLVAHQEVIFGALGQTLTIRHDSLSRESFMPGVLMAAKRIGSVTGLVVGLENIF